MDNSNFEPMNPLKWFVCGKKINFTLRDKGWTQLCGPRWDQYSPLCGLSLFDQWRFISSFYSNSLPFIEWQQRVINLLKQNHSSQVESKYLQIYSIDICRGGGPITTTAKNKIFVSKKTQPNQWQLNRPYEIVRSFQPQCLNSMIHSLFIGLFVSLFSLGTQS